MSSSARHCCANSPHLDVASISCQQQRRLSFRAGLVEGCASCQQHTDDISMPVPRSHMQCSLPEGICQRGTCSMLQEKPHTFHMAACSAATRHVASALVIAPDQHSAAQMSTVRAMQGMCS